MNKHYSIKVIGRVQGIGFRYSTYEKFVELGLEGRAENGSERDVLIDVAGPEDKLSQLIDWCHRGPSGARVDSVEVTELSTPFVPLKNG